MDQALLSLWASSWWGSVDLRSLTWLCPCQQHTPLRPSSAPHIPSSCMPLLSRRQALSTLATVLGFLVSQEIKWQGSHRRGGGGSAHCLLHLPTPSQSAVSQEQSGLETMCCCCELPELPPRFVVGLTVCCGFQLPELGVLWNTEPDSRNVPLFSGWRRVKGVSVQLVFKFVVGNSRAGLCGICLPRAGWEGLKETGV